MSYTQTKRCHMEDEKEERDREIEELKRRKVEKEGVDEEEKIGGDENNGLDNDMESGLGEIAAEWNELLTSVGLGSSSLDDTENWEWEDGEEENKEEGNEEEEEADGTVHLSYDPSILTESITESSSQRSTTRRYFVESDYTLALNRSTSAMRHWLHEFRLAALNTANPPNRSKTPHAERLFTSLLVSEDGSPIEVVGEAFPRSGLLKLAERIRQRVKLQPSHSDISNVKLTASPWDKLEEVINPSGAQLTQSEVTSSRRKRSQLLRESVTSLLVHQLLCGVLVHLGFRCRLVMAVEPPALAPAEHADISSLASRRSILRKEIEELKRNQRSLDRGTFRKMTRPVVEMAADGSGLRLTAGGVLPGTVDAQLEKAAMLEKRKQLLLRSGEIAEEDRRINCEVDHASHVEYRGVWIEYLALPCDGVARRGVTSGRWIPLELCNVVLGDATAVTSALSGRRRRVKWSHVVSIEPCGSHLVDCREITDRYVSTSPSTALILRESEIMRASWLLAELSGLSEMKNSLHTDISDFKNEDFVEQLNMETDDEWGDASLAMAIAASLEECTSTSKSIPTTAHDASNNMLVDLISSDEDDLVRDIKDTNSSQSELLQHDVAMDEEVDTNGTAGNLSVMQEQIQVSFTLETPDDSPFCSVTNEDELSTVSHQVVDLSDSEYGLPLTRQPTSSFSISATPLSERERERAELAAAAQLTASALPTTLAGFMHHPHYVIERHLGVEEVIHPDAKPVSTFRGESVYSVRDRYPLRSRGQWRRLMRAICEDAEPVKLLRRKIAERRPDGSYSSQRSSSDIDPNTDTHISVALFGEWQTMPWSVPEVDADGNLPVNDHGSIEVWDGDERFVPRGAVLVSGGSDAVSAASWLGIPYAPAVFGFDRRPGGGPIPRIGGVIVLQVMKEVVEAAVAQRIENKAEERRKSKEQAAINRWGNLVRTLLSRETLRRRYGH